MQTVSIERPLKSERPENRGQQTESVPFSPQADVPMEQDSETEQNPVKSVQSLGEATLVARLV